MDNRYSRDQENEPGIADDERTTLGDVQEKWLREEIMNSTAHFTILGAGIQMIPDDRHQELFYKKSLLKILTATNSKT